MLEEKLTFRLSVSEFNSIAIRKPRIVTVSADVFRYKGMVICGTSRGWMLFEMRNPAKMLPTARRLIELISIGLFSFILWGRGNRGWLSRA